MLEDSDIWVYAGLSKIAKEHGGPEALIDDIREGAYADGKSAGVIEGVAVSALAVVLFQGGKWLYGKVKSWYSTHRRGQESTDELKAALREYEAQQATGSSIDVEPSANNTKPDNEE